MKRLFAIFLMFAMLGQAFVRTAWVVHYQWNKAVYMKHCENKNRPKLHCDGKCQLKKKVQASESDTDKSAPILPEGFRNGKDLQVFWEAPMPLLINGAVQIEKADFHPFTAYCAPAHLFGVFRPPAV